MTKKLNRISGSFLFLTLFLFLCSIQLFAQIETVPLNHKVYEFLKEMKVKGVLESIHDETPNLTRKEVINFLSIIGSKYSELSSTEKSIYLRYKAEFDISTQDSTNTTNLFGAGNLLEHVSDGFATDKMKYLYSFKNNDANIFVNAVGHLNYGHFTTPETNNAEIYDIGFRFHGTLFNHLGYSLAFSKGLASGRDSYDVILDPRLNYNFKFVEKLEIESGYDYTEGYLRYETEPIKDLEISAQIGREPIRLGYGYGSQLILSSTHADLDMIRFNIKYGAVSFTSIHASTVGPFVADRKKDYTKYIAANRVTVSIKDAVNLGITEVIIYSDRGLDLAYLNPLLFYKFAEMSLQDRDNGTIALDLQTTCFKNFEIQGTFFLDEDILSQLADLSIYSNKTGYQLGCYWYSPFGISDLSLIAEYTRIRPFVYTHYNEKNTYTSWSELLGHRIGGNSDEILLKAMYNLNEKTRLHGEYRKVRTGKNIYDDKGELLVNAGSDPLQMYRLGVDPDHIEFLRGAREDHHYFNIGVTYEPVRSFIFDLSYNYIYNNFIYQNTTSDLGYINLKFTLEY